MQWQYYRIICILNSLKFNLNQFNKKFRSSKNTFTFVVSHIVVETYSRTSILRKKLVVLMVLDNYFVNCITK